jgi:hypothetical protein
MYGRVVVFHLGPSCIGIVYLVKSNHKVNHISDIVTDEFCAELLYK